MTQLVVQRRQGPGAQRMQHITEQVLQHLQLLVESRGCRSRRGVVHAGRAATCACCPMQAWTPWRRLHAWLQRAWLLRGCRLTWGSFRVPGSRVRLVAQDTSSSKGSRISSSPVVLKSGLRRGAARAGLSRQAFGEDEPELCSRWCWHWVELVWALQDVGKGMGG